MGLPPELEGRHAPGMVKVRLSLSAVETEERRLCQNLEEVRDGRTVGVGMGVPV